MRCQACDSIMDSDEIIWLPDKKSHEPLLVQHYCQRLILSLGLVVKSFLPAN